VELGNDTKFHCELCNTRLKKKKFHVKNRYTGEILWVGANCYQNIINRVEGTLGQTYTPDQAKKYEEFINGNSSITVFINDRPTGKSKYIQPSFIVEAEEKVIKGIRDYIRHHVITGLANENKYEDLYAGMNKVKKMVYGFDEKANHMTNLSRPLADEIVRTQSNGNEIVQRVSRNKGEISSQIAQSIKGIVFLSNYISDEEVHWKDLKLSVQRSGEIKVTVVFQGLEFSLNIPATIVIDKLGYPMNLEQMGGSWDLLNILTYHHAGVPSDTTTKNNLQILAIRSLRKSGYRECKIRKNELSNYIKKRESNIKEKTQFSGRRFEEMINRIKLYWVGEKLVELNANELRDLGLLVLESQKLAISNEQLTKFENISIDMVLERLYKDMQFIA